MKTKILIFYQWHSHRGVKVGQCAPLTAKKIAKNWENQGEKERKVQEKEEK